MEIRAVFTFRSEVSFPAKAINRVVFPEPGGPKSKVILQDFMLGKHSIISIRMALGHTPNSEAFECDFLYIYSGSDTGTTVGVMQFFCHFFL